MCMWWDYIVGYICGGHEWVEAGVVRRVCGVCCAVGMCVGYMKCVSDVCGLCKVYGVVGVYVV